MMWFKHPYACFLLVNALSLAAVAVAESRTPSYTIGEIPSLSVWRGDVLRVQILAPTDINNPSFSLVASPPPRGQISISPTGAFAYSPDSDDKFQFKVTFKVTSSNHSSIQNVIVTPLQHLESEFTIISAVEQLPPADADCIYTDLTASDAVDFNGASHHTRKVQISGKQIIFDAALDTSDCHPYAKVNHSENSDDNANVSELSVFAEKVIVRSPLWLPQTNVTIYAQDLKFEDKAGSPIATIKTTPVDYSRAADPATGDMTQGKDGAPGLPAGSLFLHIQSIDVTSTNKRFLLTGGRGQAGGQGHTGEAGPNMPAVLLATTPMTGNPDIDDITQHAVYVEGRDRAGNFASVVAGQKVWPHDGLPGVPAGSPGIGGKGGDLSSTLPIADQFADRGQGRAGQIGEATAGGAPGTPNPAYWIAWYPDPHPPADTIFARHYQSPGSQGVPPLAANQQLARCHLVLAPLPQEESCAVIDIGPKQDGAFVALQNDNYAWLHPMALAAVIDYIKHAFLGRNIAFVQRNVDSYLGILNSHTPPPQDFDDDFEKARSELTSIQFRVLNNLDYFGNPPGWVPFESLDLWMRAYSDEVDGATRLLYLTAYLDKMAQQNRTDIAALEETRTQLQNDARNSVQQFNDSANVVGELQVEATDIQNEIDTVQTEIAQKEASLAAEASFTVAQKNEFKNAATSLATICKLIPVGQPLFGVIGQGWDLMANYNASDPIATLKQIPDVVSQLNDDTFKKSEDSFKQAINAVTYDDGTTALDYSKKLNQAAKQYGPSIQKIIDTTQAAQVPHDEVQAELLRLKQSDPQLTKEVSDVSDLMAKKEAFSQKLAQAMQALTSAPGTIQNDMLAIDVTKSQIDNRVTQMDQRTLVLLRSIRDAQLDRLLKYKYLMAKAYEYRMLSPYFGTLDSNSIADKLTQMLSTASTLDTNAFESLKDVYKADVKDVMSRELTDFQNIVIGRSQEFRFGLTDDQLTQLNQVGEITVYLGDKIPRNAGEENRRIANLGIATENNRSEVAVHFEPPNAPSGRVQLFFLHSGESILMSGGKLFRFVHTQSDNASPFQWSAVEDIDGTVAVQKYSAEGLSALATILGITLSDDDPSKLIAFSYPGADANLTIKRSVSGDVRVASIGQLRVSVTVNFFYGDPNRVMLHVLGGTTGAAYVRCNQTDLNGRGDGRGEFSRIYTKGQAITLEAEPTFGDLTFHGWQNGSGAIVKTTPDIPLTLEEDTVLVPVYSAARP